MSDNLKTFNPVDLQRQVIRSLKLTIGDEEGIIYFKPITARLLQSLAEGDLSDKDAVTRISIRLTETLVNEDGSPLMTVEQMFDVPWETQKYIMERIAEETSKGKGGPKPGEDSSVATVQS